MPTGFPDKNIIFKSDPNASMPHSLNPLAIPFYPNYYVNLKNNTNTANNINESFNITIKINSMPLTCSDKFLRDHPSILENIPTPPAHGETKKTPSLCNIDNISRVVVMPKFKNEILDPNVSSSVFHKRKKEKHTWVSLSALLMSTSSKSQTKFPLLSDVSNNVSSNDDSPRSRSNDVNAHNSNIFYDNKKINC